MVDPESYMADALVALNNASDMALTGAEIADRMPYKPTGMASILKDLYDGGYVAREGSGVSVGAYRYTLTPLGTATARDLEDGDQYAEDEPPEPSTDDAGDKTPDENDALNDDEEKPDMVGPDDSEESEPDDGDEDEDGDGNGTTEPDDPRKRGPKASDLDDPGHIPVDETDEDSEVEPDAVDRLIGESVDDLRHTVESLEERVGDLEDGFDAQNNRLQDAISGMRELDDRLSAVEERIGDGDAGVTLPDDVDVADVVYHVANADVGTSSTKTEIIAALLGANGGDGE